MGNALTKQEIVKEIVKAGKDPVYFTINYCRISHPQRGLIPFKAYDYQQELLRDFNDYRFNIILKARQLGISTISAAYGLLLLKQRSESSMAEEKDWLRQLGDTRDALCHSTRQRRG